MAGRARVVARAFALALAYAGAAGAARAQAYATLHVRSFTLSVDRASVALGEPFHLTIAAHVDERVVQIDNVTLPDLSGFESLGDERRCVASANGSDCAEIVTLAATVAGRRAIGGATLDAIDARNGKPSRFTSDSVSIDVSGNDVVDDWGGVVASYAFGALRAALVLVLVSIALGALLWGFATRRAKRATPATFGAAPHAVPAAGSEVSAQPLHDSIEALGREPTRANALRLRYMLREAMQARADETFGDLAARRAASPAQLAALHAVERAAFCEDARVADAAREALPFLSR
ncbi:MAG: hypothetical protein IAI49_13825 [Candidatus Eremiobacteraeota bacterium]|nr:hypothetical protein [Candidatus Eremiobacteraeota bacterium]